MADMLNFTKRLFESLPAAEVGDTIPTTAVKYRGYHFG